MQVLRCTHKGWRPHVSINWVLCNYARPDQTFEIWKKIFRPMKLITRLITTVLRLAALMRWRWSGICICNSISSPLDHVRQNLKKQTHNIWTICLRNEKTAPEQKTNREYGYCDLTRAFTPTSVRWAPFIHIRTKLTSMAHPVGSSVYSYIQPSRPRQSCKKLMSPCSSQSLSSDGNKIAAKIVPPPPTQSGESSSHKIEFPSVTIRPNCSCSDFPSISVQQPDTGRIWQIDCSAIK